MPQPFNDRRKKRSGFATVLRLLIVMLLLGGVGASALYIAKGFTEAGADALPTFDSAPLAFGTITVDIEEAGTMKMRLTSNATVSNVHVIYLPDSKTTPQLQVLMNGQGRFVMLPESPTWMLEDRLGSTALAGAFDSLLAPTFAAYIPDAVRDYTQLVSRDAAVVGGRNVQRYELLVASKRLRAERPTEYDAWMLAVEPDELLVDVERVVLYLDDAGTVWKYETWGDTAPSEIWSVTLVSFSVEEFLPEFPVTYIDDTNGGVLVGG